MNRTARHQAIRKPLSRSEGRSSAAGQLWAIVLAGGEGVRLRPLTRHLYGEDRPKQYATLTGARSLLRQTLDRIALLIPPERTVVVTMDRHFRWLTEELGMTDHGPWVLAQPEDRGTAAGVLLPALWIQARDEKATVAVFPSDHLVIEEEVFMAHVEATARFVEARPDCLVLLGAPPTEPETEYGWIAPAERLGWTDRGPVYRVRRFVEKPQSGAARALYASGALWNTLVFAARASMLVAAGRECVPALDARLRQALTFAGTEHERWALRQAFALAPRANFSRAVLEAWPLPLGVSKMRDVRWFDLGNVDRVLRTLAGLGISPSWATALRHPRRPGTGVATESIPPSVS